MTRARHIGLIVAAFALACSRVEPTAIDTASSSELDMSAPATLVGEVVEVRLLDADDRPVADAALGLSGTDAPKTDADGRVRFVVTHEQLAAPLVYLRATLADGNWLYALVPAGALQHATLRLPAELASDRPLEIVLDQPDPSVQAWFDVLIWHVEQRDRWYAAESVEAKLAVWQRVREDIAAESDEHVRALKIAAQFAIGRADPSAGLERKAAAEHALEQLALDDPHWAIWPPALTAAVWESGRWDSLDILDEQISVHPQPEVAAHLMAERYATAINQGRWQHAESLWARWQARPELHATFAAKLIESYGPDRRLAPGKRVPTLCGETLDGGRVCTDALEGLTVIEFYAVWCKGCRESFPKVATTVASLADTKPQPQLLTLEVYNDRAEVESFVGEVPMAGRHAWLPASERDAVRDELQLEAVPVMVIVGPDGTILDSSPHIGADNLDARLRHWQAIVGDRP